MVFHDFLKAPHEVAVLSGDGGIRSRLASALEGRTYHATDDVEAFVATIIARRVRSAVIDRDSAGAEQALQRLARLPGRAQMLVMVLVRDPIGEPPHGADVVVVEPVLVEALALTVSGARIDERPVILDRLLGVSLLYGPLDQALERTADQLAAGFGVDRCLIVLREDSTAGAANGTHTWSSLTWSYTAERCRAAAAAGASLVAPVPDNPRVPCETYLAVPLETGGGASGFLGLVVAKPRRFTSAVGEALQAVATRLTAEATWRGSHERAIDELDRLANGPALDSLLGIWNSAGLKQLAGMQIALADRNDVPITALVLDVVDLQMINQRHGLDVGDRLLRRIAEAVRATVREEDVVGRWAGDAIAVVLHGVANEGAQRAAERLRATLAARPLELPGEGSLAIPVSIGIAQRQAKETVPQLMLRASHAASRAQSEGQPIRNATTQSTNPRLSGEIPLLPSEDIGSTIGGTYRLLHEISRGGMGVVYRAQDRALERPVAIKMLRPDLADDAELVERFRVEASMLAGVHHPNLVQIYSFGHGAGDSYFVMELVEGESLEQAIERHRIERTAMPLAEVPSLFAQIASALDVLHERGIVHRDVKPANIIRDPFRNRSVLVDVGIARRFGQQASSAGTPGFIAPEVMGGAEATPQSDVYGLAATAYAILTLTRPWGDADFMGLVARQLANELRPASAIRPELAPIDDVLRRALDADPQHRYASAGVFVKALVESLPVILPRERSDSELLRPLRKTTPVAAAAPKTRGVVFRSVSRALGLRAAERLRDQIGGEQPELVRALTDSAPLAWLDTGLLTKLFEVAPPYIGRERAAFARDVAKATVRASFRRFFPASATTLVPERTLSAIRNVWSRYHSWGVITSMPTSASESVVRLRSSPRDAALCAWTSGLLEQLVILSGASRAAVAHDACEVVGSDACLFRVSWERQ